MTAASPPPSDVPDDEPDDVLDGLPAGWSARTAPGLDDVVDLRALRARHEETVRGRSSLGLAAVTAEVTGPGASTHSRLLVRDAAGVARGWVDVHDRAAGHVVVEAVVDPALEDTTGDTLAGTLFGWAHTAAAAHARARGLPVTQLDCGTFEQDVHQQRRLAAAGYAHVRTWWQMRRPVTDADRVPARPVGPGVRIRPVAVDPVGMPDERDLATVHDVLEEAFTDHFNHHVETFDEFVTGLRADPGHRWDHWWLGELVDGPAPEPAGALVAGALLAADGTVTGTYVNYLGVLRTARGRGLASSLLDTVLADAAARGRTSVALEVDADSPTRAGELYLSLGFTTDHVTQSWHRELAIG